ncbi:MAG: hypothetical protein QM758_18205 [Armatimonas sp.]
MTWQESQAHLTIGAGLMMACSLEAMPSERLEWVPEVPGAVNLRSAMALASECVHTNKAIAGMLSGETPAEDAANPTFQDGADAATQIRESSKIAAAAIRSLPDEALEATYQTFFAPLPGRILLTIPLVNMNYHNGQLNLLQLLYGDAESHFPDFS